MASPEGGAEVVEVSELKTEQAGVPAEVREGDIASTKAGVTQW
jgi:hypothetical protein